MVADHAGGVAFNPSIQPLLSYHGLENDFRSGRTANVAQADEKDTAGCRNIHREQLIFHRRFITMRTI